MSLKKLFILTAFLFVTSLFVYWKENYRSSDLISGSYYIKGLNLNKIDKISLKFEKDKEIDFKRDQRRFVLNNYKSYPAATDKVNQLIYQIASIQVKKKVTSKASDEELKSYGLTQETKKYHIEIYNNEGEKILSFFVGKKFKNKGHYLLKEESGEIYLSQDPIQIDSSYKDFVNRILVNADKDSVNKVSIHAKETLEIERLEKEFALLNSKKEAKKDKLNNYIAGFSSALFEDFFRHDDEKVQNIEFDREVNIQLNSKLTYNLKFGEKNGEYFVKATALASQIPNEVVINQDTENKKLENIGNMLQAKQKANQFNLTKNPWIYLIDKSNYEKFIKNLSEFM